MDYSQLSDEELTAIVNKDYSKLSTETLYRLSGKPVEFDPAIAAQNLIPSASKMVGNMYNAATHPLDTIENADAAIRSLGAKGLGTLGVPVDAEDTASADAIIKGIKNQYGSWDKAKITAMEDPVQVASDLAGTLGMAGKVPGLGALGTASKLIDPMRIAGAGTRLARKGLIEALPADLATKVYQSVSGITDPATVETLLRNKLNPAKPEDIAKLKAMRDQEGKSLRDIVENNGGDIFASELFQNMRDRKEIMDEINVSAGAQGNAMGRHVQKMADHLGYRPAMTDPDFPMIWGNKPIPPKLIDSGMLDANGNPLKMVNPEWADLQVTKDKAHPLVNVWELEKGGWDAITNKNDSHLRQAPPSASAGTLAAKQEATFNADRLIEDQLKHTDFGQQNKTTAEVIRAHTAAEKAHPSLVKRNNPFSAVGSVPISTAGAAGYAIGGPKMGAAAAGTALGISLLNTPDRVLDLMSNVYGYKNQSLGELLRETPSSGKNALVNIVDKLEEERKRQQAAAMRRR